MHPRQASSPTVGLLPRAVFEALQAGLAHCRRGEWDQGLAYLGQIANSGSHAALPGLFYSYLGYGIARCQQRVPEGLKLCHHSIKLEFYHPENYINLARTQLLNNDRRGAVEAIRGGLKIDPQNVELLALARDVGVRRSPILGFLSRNNPLNRLLGAIRHQWTGK